MTRRLRLAALAGSLGSWLLLGTGCTGEIGDPEDGGTGGNGCTPTTCVAQGKNCGALSDGCNSTLQCGTCSGQETCGGGGTANVCGVGTCTPNTCAAQGKNCGSIGDGCGGTLACGQCSSPQTCGGGGTPNVCGNTCTPTTCSAQSKNCGSIPDGCGGTLNCGQCTSPQTCGGGGTPNVCGGSGTCTPTTCSAQGKNCGSIGDGCGGTLNCGQCNAPDSCGGGGTPNVCGGGSGIDQSALPDIYRTPWNPGIPGGIPADNDPVRPATVWLPAGNPYGGYSVNPALTGTANAAAFTSALQAAVNSAGAAATPTSRKIVLLKAGSYFVNQQSGPAGQVGIYVRVDNVTIRGEGADVTRLSANGTIHQLGAVVLFGHRSGTSDASFNVTAVTADALRGATQIQVASTSGFSVGDVVTVDVQDGAASAQGSVYFNSGYLWFYDGQYFKRQPTYGWSGPSTGAGAINVSDLTSANAAAQNVVPNWRSTMQANEITAIASNSLTLKDPLYIDFPLARSPQVWITVPANTSGSLGNRWSGIENIAVAGGNNEWGFPGGTVNFSYMAYCWAKNIEADGTKASPADPQHPGKLGYNIGLGRSYRCVIRDSYAHGSADENPGGQAYGLVVGAGSTACLVENNISVDNNKPVALNSTGGGNVISYNYVDNAVIWNSPSWQENAIDDCHANFTHHDLVEGNWTPNIGGDTTHGNSGWHTHFRNFASGRNSAGNPTANLRAVGMDGWTHFHAYLANVLKGGTVYETNPSQKSGTPIYQLGNNAQGVGGNWDNGYSAAHVYRDGNWDNVNNGVVWVGGAKTLPPSFYLISKPPFFGSNAWPWVDGPTGNAGTLPAKARYDASTPNQVP